MMAPVSYAAALLLLLCCTLSGRCDQNEEENYQVIENALIQLVGEVESNPVDPELDMTTPEIIAHRGYPVEVHFVTTVDGYILELHRIPFGLHEATKKKRKKKNKMKRNKKAPRPVIFLQHGLLCSSSDWILNPTNKALGYMLADRGYDVWMGNARGNTYSRQHVNLSTSDDQYWKFTWDEMGRYDIPAELNYVLNKTERQKLIYIGHSMGTTMFWVAMETQPQLNERIELMVGLAPVASVAQMKSPVKFLTPYFRQLELLFQFFGTHAFLPSGRLMRLFEKYACDQSKWESDFCENILFFLSGSDPDNFNEDMIPLITAHAPAGTSTHTMIHYMQEYVSSERFQRMDWGPKMNLEEYGTESPPPYNLTSVKAPVVLFWGDNDWLATPKDVAWLAKRLDNLRGFYRVNSSTFNHLDFLWATNVDEILYVPLFNLLPSFH